MAVRCAIFDVKVKGFLSVNRYALVADQPEVNWLGAQADAINFLGLHIWFQPDFVESILSLLSAVSVKWRLQTERWFRRRCGSSLLVSCNIGKLC